MTITMEADARPAQGHTAWPSRSRRGFTLAELLVSLGLSGILLTAILTTFIFIARGGTRLMHYRDIETRASLTLQQFAIDARQASTVTWVNANTLTLQAGSSGTVTYTYDSANGSLVRRASEGNRTLATNINTFRFVAFDRDGTALSLAAANVNARTKMVQLEIGFRSRSGTVEPVERDIISARYMLRNKTST
jgi:prepilin-type N-terminal cleavage/methylation domain-containing protein